jgi:ABC-type dipeptide/oligopeptide/nickel transport system permease subunit
LWTVGFITNPQSTTTEHSPLIWNQLLALHRQQDRLWLIIWLGGLGALGLWDALFLNLPAFTLVQRAFLNTLFAGVLVVVFSLVLGWSTGIMLHFLDTRRRTLYLMLAFVLNIIRSIPQIVGILLGYVILTIFVEQEILRSQFSQLLWMALVIAVFVFLEVVDLVRERIAYYNTLDFFQAMLCCGISEGRIINHEILWKNSRAHLLHKLVSIFGVAIFLQCSIDFIISIGLSSDVSLSNFPVTLGSLLAKLDSKQDILAIGTVFSSMTNISSLLFEHLQGVSVAFVIVFTLLCIYKISNGLIKRHSL